MSGAGGSVALLRFLRQEPRAARVLNGGDPAPAGDSRSAVELSCRLVEAVQRGELRDRNEASPFRRLAGALRMVDPAGLETDAERIATWINIYDALAADAVYALAVRGSIREARGFFRAAAYRVGEHTYTLSDIENGLLLGNRPLHPRLAPPFAEGDPRQAVGPGMVDPRVHFALHCATRSCPPIRAYDPVRLDEALDDAVRQFVANGGVRLEGGTVVLSAIFDFYAVDFGGPANVAEWVSSYVDDPELRMALERGPIVYEEYDWSLAEELSH